MIDYSMDGGESPLVRFTKVLQDESNIVVMGVSKEHGVIRVAINEEDTSARNTVKTLAFRFKFDVADVRSEEGRTVIDLTET